MAETEQKKLKLEGGEDNFKPVFKYYKSRNPPPSLENVIDISDSNKWQDYVEKLTLVENEDYAKNVQRLGLIDSSKWQVVTLNSGLVLIRNPFTAKSINYWCSRCLKDFACNPPFKTNLDISLNPPYNWYDQVITDSHSELVNKLRWSTLGYHHDWDTKEYSLDSTSVFPEDLALLSETILACTGLFNHQKPTYKAEAAIVNFYNMDSTLGGHIDFSEPNTESPLLSVSFGQSAIFLIGGPAKSEKPKAILIRNGDVVIMSESARQSYHAVPKILKADSLSNLLGDVNDGETGQKQGSSDDDVFVTNYLNSHRINMNVRQVF